MRIASPHIKVQDVERDVDDRFEEDVEGEEMDRLLVCRSEELVRRRDEGQPGRQWEGESE